MFRCYCGVWLELAVPVSVFVLSSPGVICGEGERTSCAAEEWGSGGCGGEDRGGGWWDFGCWCCAGGWGGEDFWDGDVKVCLHEVHLRVSFSFEPSIHVEEMSLCLGPSRHCCFADDLISSLYFSFSLSLLCLLCLGEMLIPQHDMIFRNWYRLRITLVHKKKVLKIPTSLRWYTSFYDGDPNIFPKISKSRHGSKSCEGAPVVRLNWSKFIIHIHTKFMLERRRLQHPYGSPEVIPPVACDKHKGKSWRYRDARYRMQHILFGRLFLSFHIPSHHMSTIYPPAKPFHESGRCRWFISLLARERESCLLNVESVKTISRSDSMQCNIVNNPQMWISILVPILWSLNFHPLSIFHQSSRNAGISSHLMNCSIRVGIVIPPCGEIVACYALSAGGASWEVSSWDEYLVYFIFANLPLRKSFNYSSIFLITLNLSFISILHSKKSCCSTNHIFSNSREGDPLIRLIMLLMFLAK